MWRLVPPFLVLPLALSCGGRTGLGVVRHDVEDSGPDAPARDAAPDSPPPVDAGVVITPSISVGEDAACVVQPTGDVKCWGQAPIGDGTEDAAPTARSIGVAGRVAQIAVLGRTGALRMDTGAVRSWGSKDSPSLGLGLDAGTWADDAGNVTSPVDVSLLGTDTTDLSGAAQHGYGRACAILVDGGVQCWGIDPQPAYGLNGPIVQTAESESFTCALRAEGSIQCWGANDHGQLGDGTTEYAAVESPATVAGITDAVAIAVGLGHACALRAGGEVECWGSSALGQLGDGDPGDGDPDQFSALPVQVVGLGGPVARLRASTEDTCAVLADGRLQCWGDNRDGDLGDGTSITRFAPSDVVDLAGPVVDVGMGNRRACALLADGRAQCWGRAPLGTGSLTQTSKVPVTVVGLP